ncbi:hypothetical protein BXZ70DRAFT_573755 [Cristinia sonorae]|uniref:Uncharacterized protein n=1 Tax=Cristinia sonorae TaxID=1940300 RepID=A0A8K0XKR0_9AGAR|nr:hypothetical protein BXZ70DRAFT_573755 [Cristinia sonorae]
MCNTKQWMQRLPWQPASHKIPLCINCGHLHSGNSIRRKKRHQHSPVLPSSLLLFGAGTLMTTAILHVHVLDPTELLSICAGGARHIAFSFVMWLPFDYGAVTPRAGLSFTISPGSKLHMVLLKAVFGLQVGELRWCTCPQRWLRSHTSPMFSVASTSVSKSRLDRVNMALLCSAGASIGQDRKSQAGSSCELRHVGIPSHVVICSFALYIISPRS